MKLCSRLAAVVATMALAPAAWAQPAPSAPPPFPPLAPPGAQRPAAQLPPPAQPPFQGVPPAAQPQPGAQPAYPGYPPYGYPYPQPAWAPPPVRQQAPMLTLRMSYDPDRGAPAGYKVFEERNTALLAGGAATLGALWVASVIAGGFIEDSNPTYYYDGSGYTSAQNKHGWPMWIPVVGPFITIGSSHSDSAGTTPLVFDGVGQAAGLAMIIAGLVVPKKVLKFQFQSTSSEVALRPAFSPLQGGAYSGLAASF
jgi:hypothetical protein